MTRRMMIIMTAGAIALGFAGLAGFGGNNAFSADDEDASQEALIKLLDTAKINLQQGLAASEQQGNPIFAASISTEDPSPFPVFRASLIA
jgi:hypothetical protein